MRKQLLSVLRFLGLNRIAGATYYRFLHGFSPAGSALPDAVKQCFERIRDHPELSRGDYCEFGVFKGYTFLHAQNLAIEFGFEQMRFFGFDSFEGLPKPEEGDVVSDGPQPFHEGQYACSLDYVVDKLNTNGVDWNRTFLTKGYFDESLASATVLNHNIKEIAIALVDCDLYSSTVDVLNFLESRLRSGSLVIMDDWKSYGEAKNVGQPRAFSELMERRPDFRFEHIFDYGSYGRVFCLKIAP